MAPEQLEGLEADARTDIFALGGVLYEMVTGRKAFEGKSQVGLIGSILEREPAPIKTVLPSAPSSLEQLIRRCLAKDPDQRWQSAADVAAQLKWIAGTAAAEETASKPATADTSRLRRRLRLWMAVSHSSSLCCDCRTPVDGVLSAGGKRFAQRVSRFQHRMERRSSPR